MNSMQNVNPNQATINKAKATAIKYEKFLAKRGSEFVKPHTRSLQGCIEKVDSALRLVWKTVSMFFMYDLVPKWLRGPSTPYQHLLISISQISIKNQIDHLPFSELTINQVYHKLIQAVLLSRVKLIVTYTENSLPATLQKITQSQQINALINKKAQILPIKIRENSNGQVSSTLKELIDNLGNSTSYEDQVFVIWKGLFQEILVIAHFQLCDPNLCLNIIGAIQERQDYEEFVRKLAKGNNDQLYDESSLNKLEQQTTAIEKQGQD